MGALKSAAVIRTDVSLAGYVTIVKRESCQEIFFLERISMIGCEVISL